MAGMIFRIETFFKGSDNFDQLYKIIKVLGEESFYKYVNKYGLTVPQEVQMMMRGRQFPKVPWMDFVNEKNIQYCDANAIDLLEKML